MMTRAKEVEAVREFNRFYTRHMGLLQEGLLRSQFSLTEVRVMFELRQRPGITASEIAGHLGINHGYMSRIVQRFESLGVLSKQRSASDKRQYLLSLTAKGQRTYAPLDARASAEVHDLLEGLSDTDVRRLLEAMQTIQGLLSPEGERR